MGKKQKMTAGEYDPSPYLAPEWFLSLQWQHHWIEKMSGWWVGRFGKPTSVCDFGAGDGWWCKAFHDFGEVETVAVELDRMAIQFIPEQVGVIIHDLREPLNIGHSFDLCICLEVAEHLPSTCAEILCKMLAKHTRGMLLFSAAGVGQIGTGHINLRPRVYWHELLRRQGLHFNASITNEVKVAFGNICNKFFDFLIENLQVYTRSPRQ